MKQFTIRLYDDFSSGGKRRGEESVATLRGSNSFRYWLFSILHFEWDPVGTPVVSTGHSIPTTPPHRRGARDWGSFFSFQKVSLRVKKIMKISCPWQRGPSKSEFEEKRKRSWKSLVPVPDNGVLQKVFLRKKIIVKSLVPDKGFLQKVNWEKKIAKNLSFRTKGSFKKWFWEKKVAKISCPGQTGPSKSEFEKKDSENFLSRTFKTEFEEKEKDRENLSSRSRTKGSFKKCVWETNNREISRTGQRDPSKSEFQLNISSVLMGRHIIQ